MQYMYNMQIVNFVYVGFCDVFSFGLLYCMQWVGFEGVLKMVFFIVNMFIGLLDNMGFGIFIVCDELGLVVEFNVNIDYFYMINILDNGELFFGLKVGFDLLDVDFIKLNIFDQNDF